MYTLQFTAVFTKMVSKLIKGDQKLEKALFKTFELLRNNPYHPSLRSHKVDTRRTKNIWSSSITGDWRIGWIFDEKENQAVLICLELGTHSGANQMYQNKSS
jgi:mRNA-degrading endonuclease YafQ of YafQ-DinJ toxin-antitoxin module